MYLILQLQCLFNTPVNFTFTGKFHTDNTQHKYPLSTNFHIFRVKLNRHTYRTPHLVYRPIYRHSPTTKFNRHTHRSVSNSTDIYMWHTNWFMHYIPTLAINMPPKLPNSADTPTKLNTTTDVELNNCSQSTYLPRYQTQPTHLPNYTHQLVWTKLSRHTYQTKHTDQCWT